MVSKYNPKTGKRHDSRQNQARVWFVAPIKEIVANLEKQGFIKRYRDDPSRAIPNAITKFIFLDHKAIILRYNAIINGYLNYFSPADNFFKLNSIMTFILRHSCAKTLARKFRLRTRAGAFKKFGKNLGVAIKKGETTKTYKLAIPEHFRNSRKFKATNRILKDPLAVLNYKLQSQSVLDEICAVCGSKERVEMHHVRHLRKDGVTATGFTGLMSALNRKQLPICVPCHKQIHKGGYNGLSLNEL